MSPLVASTHLKTPPARGFELYGAPQFSTDAIAMLVFPGKQRSLLLPCLLDPRTSFEFAGPGQIAHLSKAFDKSAWPPDSGSQTSFLQSQSLLNAFNKSLQQLNHRNLTVFLQSGFFRPIARRIVTARSVIRAVDLLNAFNKSSVSRPFPAARQLRPPPRGIATMPPQK